MGVLELFILTLRVIAPISLVQGFMELIGLDLNVIEPFGLALGVIEPIGLALDVKNQSTFNVNTMCLFLIFCSLFYTICCIKLFFLNYTGKLKIIFRIR